MSTLANSHTRLAVRERRVPLAWWMPVDQSGPCPLVLVGHGGSGHKTSSLVLDIVQRMLPAGIAVAAIDGPVHGERREVFVDGPVVRDEFRELWSRGGAVDAMVDDWRAALNHLCQNARIDEGRVAWYGISMGTAYGLPVVAAEPRIRAAVLGMWGTCRSPSDRLLADAHRIAVPVLFQVKREDALFTAAGQRDLFDQLASPHKQYVEYDGEHVDPSGPQLDDIAGFLHSHLLQSHRRA
jgi:dienelactone hydrolase